jgi:hypothetical protein
MEKSVFMATGCNILGGSTFPSKKECTTLIEYVKNLLKDNVNECVQHSLIVSPVRNYGNSLTGVGINIITINPALPHGDPNILSAIEETLTFSTQT